MNRRGGRSPGGSARRSGWVLRAVGVAVLPLALSACSGDEGHGETYHPAEVVDVSGSDVKQVTFTEDAARRVGLATATAESSGPHVTVPYEALVYDGQGESWVYEVSDDLSFMRQAVTVDRIEADVVFLTKGLEEGDTVVTTGSTEVYGEELGIGGSH